MLTHWPRRLCFVCSSDMAGPSSFCRRAVEVQPAASMTTAIVHRFVLMSLRLEPSSIDLALQPLSQFGREPDDLVERPVVEPNTVDQAGFVASDDGRTRDVEAEGRTFPFEERLAARDGLVRKVQPVVHRRRGGEEGAHELHTDAAFVHDRRFKGNGPGKRRGELCRPIFARQGSPGAARRARARCHLTYERPVATAFVALARRIWSTSFMEPPKVETALALCPTTFCPSCTAGPDL